MSHKAWLCLFLAVISFNAAGQECTTTVLASFYDQLTKDEIETLKTEDFAAKSDGKALPALGASRDFHSRFLILLQTEGSAQNDKLADLVNTVTLQARQIPD